MLPIMKLSRNFLPCLSLLSASQRFNSTNVPVLPPEEEEKKNRHPPGYLEFYGLLHRTNITWKEIMDWRHKRQLKKLKDSQKFLAERHKILGPDLAVTHFIAYRGGRVRFLGSSDWVTKENIEKKEVPDRFSPEFYVEAIDASGTLLCYEGFANFIHLRCIKELYLRECSYVDDFCLHRLYVMAPTLEYLDISGCTNVTERGICTLHRLRKLKKLVIHNTPKIAHRELACLMLQDVLPKCEIEGVDYYNPALLRRLKKYFNESDKLLEEDKTQKLSQEQS